MNCFTQAWVIEVPSSEGSKFYCKEKLKRTVKLIISVKPNTPVRLTEYGLRQYFSASFTASKTWADSKPNYICKTQFSCPPRPNGGIRTVIRYAQTNSYSKAETFSTIWNSSTWATAKLSGGADISFFAGGFCDTITQWVFSIIKGCWKFLYRYSGYLRLFLQPFQSFLRSES